MKSITLETERLVLREFKMEDADEVFKNWTSDPEVAKYVRWSAHKTIDDTIEYLKNVMNTYENTENFEWCITLKETGELIGAIVAFKAEDGKRYELGYNISRKHWRKGYTTEALKRVMKYLVDDLGYASFRCSHAKENPASGAVMRKVGFKYVKDETYEKFDKSQVLDSKVYYLDVITLKKPIKEYEMQAIEYKKEHFDNGENHIHASMKWGEMDSYDEWLDFLETSSHKETVPNDWTVSTEFFGIRKSDNKLVGMINIRHELTTDFLRNYAGHIGYGIRPSERRKGYMTQMLDQALKYCKDELNLKKVIISCEKENEGSRKTILNAGGKLEKEYVSDKGENVQVYWVDL